MTGQPFSRTLIPFLLWVLCKVGQVMEGDQKS